MYLSLSKIIRLSCILMQISVRLIDRAVALFFKDSFCSVTKKQLFFNSSSLPILSNVIFSTSLKSNHVNSPSFLQINKTAQKRYLVVSWVKRLTFSRLIHWRHVFYLFNLGVVFWVICEFIFQDEIQIRKISVSFG